MGEFDLNVNKSKETNTTKGTTPSGSSNVSAQKTSSNDPVIYYVLQDADKGVNLQKTDIPKEQQEQVLLYIERMIKESGEIITEREKDAGAVSWAVNAWLEIINSENAKSNAKKNVKNTEEDLKRLQKAALGELFEYDLLTGKPEKQSFRETFKRVRGVEYNQKNIDECMQKANEYAQVKMRTEMINQVKSMLLGSTKGDVQSQMNPETSSAAILKALKMCGLGKKSDVQKFLTDFSEKYKDNPIIKKYGGDFQLFKNQKGQYEIYRKSKSGSNEVATNEELRLIAEELSKNLDKEYAKALSINVPENATAEQLSELTQQTYNKYKKEYEDSFAKAFGKKDIKILSEKFAQTQAAGVAYVEMGLNMLSMAAMILPSAGVGISGLALKGAQATGKGVQLATKAVKVAEAVQKGSQIIAPVLMGNVILNPVELFEQLSSDNGMSEKEWENWGKGVIENTIYMALGMSASKIAEQGAAMYKTRALVKTLQQAGRSADEISAMISANPLKFPEEIAKSMKHVDRIAKSLQISTESAIDLSSTYLANKVLGNGDLTTMDWIMSVGTALMGGTIQKQFAPLTTEAKVKYLKDAFKDLKITDDIAINILKAMDDISAGKIDVKTGARMLPEVEITASRSHNPDVEQTNSAHGNRGDFDTSTEVRPEKESKPERTSSNNIDDIFKGFELDLTPRTYEQTYKDMAPIYKQQGYNSEVIRKLNLTSLNILDETGAEILRSPDIIDRIIERVETDHGFEVKNQVFEALMSNPLHRKTIIENAHGQAEKMRWSTHNWKVEDVDFKNALKHVECLEELNALRNRLKYDLESVPEDLRPKYEALQTDLVAKRNDLAAKCYTSMADRNPALPLPTIDDYKRIITEKLQECDDFNELQKLKNDINSYCTETANQRKEAFADIDKFIAQKTQAIEYKNTEVQINQIKSMKDLRSIEHSHSDNPQVLDAIAKRRESLSTILEKGYQDFVSGKSNPDIETFEGIIEYKLESCKTLEDLVPLKNLFDTYNKTSNIWPGKANGFICGKEVEIRRNILRDFAQRIEQCSTQEELNALRKEFRAFKKADDYYSQLEIGEFGEYKRGEIHRRGGKFSYGGRELIHDDSILDAYREIDNKIKAKEYKIDRDSKPVVDLSNLSDDEFKLIFGDESDDVSAKVGVAETSASSKGILSDNKSKINPRDAYGINVEEKISHLDKVTQFKQTDPEFYNEILDWITNIVIKDANGDNELILSRLASIDDKFLATFYDNKTCDLAFILDNYNDINTIKNNIRRKFAWNTDCVLEAINKDNISSVLEASERVKDGDQSAINYLQYVQYSREAHSVKYSDQTVDVSTKVVMALLTGRQANDNAQFDREISSLFTTDVDMLEKKAYGRSLKGIIEQHPELLDIVNTTKNMSPEEYNNYINSLPETISMKKFSPDEVTNEGPTVVGAYMHMRDNKLGIFR